ncbi:MAG TPA: ABC transporter ATP-binding protein [Steroidobacteraceae bacterium]
MSGKLLNVTALGVALGGNTLLKDVTFELDSGEILGLVGASGSGKSMTALALMQLLPPGAQLAGKVALRDEILTGKGAEAMRAFRGRDIGMVFQEPMSALNPLMPIGEQIAETVRLHREVSRKEAFALAREALDAVGLTGESGSFERYPYQLSGGQRQRVAIAIAIVLSPALLIADEPTTALDVIAQAQVLALLKELARARRMGLILITHDLAVIAAVADRVAVMQAGTIVESGYSAALLRNPVHPYTRSLLAAARMPRKSTFKRPSAAVVETRGIVKEYRRARRSLWRAPQAVRAVDGVSLTVHAGETVGLVGESGSGKSSLLRVILALQRAQQGEVRLLDEHFPASDGLKLRRQRRAIQVVFQDPVSSFDPRWNVERIVAEPFHLLDTPPSPAESRRLVAEALEQVGLSAADSTRLPHEFSGGQRQRIAIARALISKPAVIALDEAVSALDVLVRQQILKLLAELAERAKLAFLFVTHDLHVVRSIADRVYVMQKGRIVEEGQTERLFGSPQHEYTRALIAATPVLPAD